MYVSAAKLPSARLVVSASRGRRMQSTPKAAKQDEEREKRNAFLESLRAKVGGDKFDEPGP